MDTILEKPFLKKDFRANSNIDCVKFFNPFKIYNENGEFFATIVHEKSSYQRLVSFFLPHKTNSYAFKITSANGNTLASVQHSRSIWRSHFRIFDKNERLVYSLFPKTKFNKLSFNVINNDEMYVAKIVADAGKSSFTMHDVYNHALAFVHKKNIHDTFCSTEYANPLDKNVLLATAICVGMYTGAYE